MSTHTEHAINPKAEAAKYAVTLVALPVTTTGAADVVSRPSAPWPVPALEVATIR